MGEGEEEEEWGFSPPFCPGLNRRRSHSWQEPDQQVRTEPSTGGVGCWACACTRTEMQCNMWEKLRTHRKVKSLQVHTPRNTTAAGSVCVFFTWKLYQLDQRTAGFNLLSAVCVSDHVGVIHFLCQIFSLSPILSRSRHHPHFFVFSDSFFDQFHSNTETRGNCSWLDDQ